LSDTNQSQEAPATLPRRENVEWPEMSNTTIWKRVDVSLESALSGSLDRKVEAFTTIAYIFCKERFREAEKKKAPGNNGNQSRRQREIQLLGKELRIVTKQCKRAGETENIGIHQLKDEETSKHVDGQNRQGEPIETELGRGQSSSRTFSGL